LTICGETNFSDSNMTAYFIGNDGSGYSLFKKSALDIDRHDPAQFVGTDSNTHRVSKYVFIVPSSSGICAVQTPSPTLAPTPLPTTKPTPMPTITFTEPMCTGATLYTAPGTGDDAAPLARAVENHFGNNPLYERRECILDSTTGGVATLGHTLRTYYKITKGTIPKQPTVVRSYDIDSGNNEQLIAGCIDGMFSQGKAIRHSQGPFTDEQYLVAVVEADADGKLYTSAYAANPAGVTEAVTGVIGDLRVHMDTNSRDLNVASAFLGLRNFASIDMGTGDKCSAEMTGTDVLAGAGKTTFSVSNRVNPSGGVPATVADSMSIAYLEQLMSRVVAAMDTFATDNFYKNCLKADGNQPVIEVAVWSEYILIEFRPCTLDDNGFIAGGATSVQATTQTAITIAKALGCFQIAGVNFNAVKMANSTLDGIANGQIPAIVTSGSRAEAGNVFSGGRAFTDGGYRMNSFRLWGLNTLDEPEFSSLRALVVPGAHSCIIEDIENRDNAMKRSQKCIEQGAVRIDVTSDMNHPHDETREIPNECWYHTGDTDGDGEDDIFDTCPNHPHVNSTNAGEVANTCTMDACVAPLDPLGDPDADNVKNCNDKCPHEANVPKLTNLVNMARSGTTLNDPVCVVEIESGCQNATMFTDEDSDGYVVCEDLCPGNTDVFTKNLRCPCWYRGDEAADTDGDGVGDCHDYCALNGSFVVRNSCGECAPEPAGDTGCPSSSGSGIDCTDDHTGKSDYHCACVDPDDCTSHDDQCSGVEGDQSALDILNLWRNLTASTDNEHVRSRIDIAFGHTETSCECFRDTTMGTATAPTGETYSYPRCIADNDKCSIGNAWIDACSESNACTNDPTLNPDCPAGGAVPCSNTGTDDKACVVSCGANGQRANYAKYADKTEPDSCGCEWSTAMSKSDTDGDDYPDCNDRCGPRKDALGNVVDTLPINTKDGYSTDDGVTKNLRDDDGDGFINCIDFCPQHFNSDPNNATSPCTQRVAPAPGPNMPGPEGSASSTQIIGFVAGSVGASLAIL